MGLGFVPFDVKHPMLEAFDTFAFDHLAAVCYYLSGISCGTDSGMG